MAKLFGTDGIRGVVNDGLDGSLAYRVGLATAQVLGREKPDGAKPRVAVGRDTRISGPLLQGALTAGLCAAGAQVLDLGILPTPGVAWAAKHLACDAGVVISASHNPFEHNGIKIFDGRGFKLSDALEEKIEEAVASPELEQNLPTHGGVGAVREVIREASEAYLDHLAGAVRGDLAGLRVLVDCANGAASATAHRLFGRFPSLEADILCAVPDGVNINQFCGSTHLGPLARRVVAEGYHLGLAFDGDADRCLAVDERGELIDGDQIMAACGLDLKTRGELPGDKVVATVMSNLGLHHYAGEHGLCLECTDVGDRNVLERMLEGGCRLGGEQSGHMIFLEHATTGDGQLTALLLLELLGKSGKKASEVFGACPRYPQVLLNLPVRSQERKDALMASEALTDAVARWQAALAGEGRILVRPSGTEALMRVMVEAKTQRQAQETAEALAEVIRALESGVA